MVTRMRCRDFRPVALAAARAAMEKKALDIQVLDIRKESDIADFLVIAGAGSSAQMRAIHDEVEDTLRRMGIHPLRQEAHPNDRWRVLDYGGVVVHILLVAAREFYRLEHLWENAKKVACRHDARRITPRA